MIEPWGVEVDTITTEVKKPERGSSYCLYNFGFTIGVAKHRLVERYSRLRDFHTRLSCTMKDLPNFPPKSWLFQSTTDSKFQEKRKHELMVYFQSLVLEPSILKHDLFHELLKLPDNLKSTMNKIAQDMESKKYVEDLHLADYHSSPFSDCKAQGDFLDSDSKMQSLEANKQCELIWRARRQRRLREIHKNFKDSLIDQIPVGDELLNEVEELMQHPKIARYQEAVSNYRIFSMYDVLPDLSELLLCEKSNHRVVF